MASVEYCNVNNDLASNHGVWSSIKNLHKIGGFPTTLV